MEAELDGVPRSLDELGCLAHSQHPSQLLLSASSQAKARDNWESIPRNIPSVTGSLVLLTLVLGGAPGDISSPCWGTHTAREALARPGTPVRTLDCPVRHWFPRSGSGCTRAVLSCPLMALGVVQGWDQVAQGWQRVTGSLH